MDKFMEKMLEKWMTNKGITDSIEIGSAGDRCKVYFNAGDPKDARDRIENALGLKEYAKTLMDLEEEIDRLEKRIIDLDEVDKELKELEEEK